jgi:hypothetical protein
MLKLSCLAAIAVVGAANLSIASAQTPTDVAADKARPAPLVSADDVPLRPNNAAVLRAAHQSPAPDGKRPVVGEAKQPKMPEGKAASIPASAAVARARHEEPRIEASASRLASLTLPNRPHVGPNVGPIAGGTDASAAAVRSTKLGHLPTDAAARSAAARAFAALPTQAAPDLRGRSAAAQHKAMRNLPKSALARQKAKSKRGPG